MDSTVKDAKESRHGKKVVGIVFWKGFGWETQCWGKIRELPNCTDRVKMVHGGESL